MKARIALHLAILVSAAAVFTATAIAKLNTNPDTETVSRLIPNP